MFCAAGSQLYQNSVHSTLQFLSPYIWFESLLCRSYAPRLHLSFYVFYFYRNNYYTKAYNLQKGVMLTHRIFYVIFNLITLVRGVIM